METYASTLLHLTVSSLLSVPCVLSFKVAGAALGAIMNLFGGYLCTPKNIKPFWKYVSHRMPRQRTSASES